MGFECQVDSTPPSINRLVDGSSSFQAEGPWAGTFFLQVLRVLWWLWMEPAPWLQPPMASAQQLWPRAVVNFHGTLFKLGRELLSSCSWVQGTTDLPPKFPCLPVMKWDAQTSKTWNVKTNFNLQQKLATEAYGARTPEIEQGKKSSHCTKKKGAAREECELQHSSLDGCQHHFGTTGMRQQRAAILIDANTFLSVHAAASVWEDQMLKRFKGARKGSADSGCMASLLIQTTL